jgi:hypothetical protein
MVWVAIVVGGCGRLDFDQRACATSDCFTLMLQAATWDQARTACHDRGPTSHLATIASLDENAPAAALAATIPFAPTASNPNQRQRMWIGGNSLDASGAWQWETDEPFDFMNWRAGEPDQVSEHCLIMLGSLGGVWDNRACETSFEAFLCEDD